MYLLGRIRGHAGAFEWAVGGLCRGRKLLASGFGRPAADTNAYRLVAAALALQRRRLSVPLTPTMLYVHNRHE